MNNNNLNNDFSGVPALDDIQGLENYLNNQNLMDAGLGVDMSNPQNTQGQEPETPNPTTDPAPAAGNGQVQYTSDQVNALIAQVSALQEQLKTQQAAKPQVQPAQPTQRTAVTYTPAQRQFIMSALEKGYSMQQIQEVLERRAGTSQAQAQIEQRMQNLEQQIKEQEYRRAESEFIGRLSTFGDKWGLSEKDLVTFGNAALQKGINIAYVNDLDAVFRAVYPEQYAIRTQRMQNTNTSQIYGGTSIPESTRVATSKAEDAYVDAFFKQTMPNQYNNFNRK